MPRKYLSSINPSFQHPLVQELKVYADTHHVPIMQDEGIHFLVQLIQIKQAKKVLEIGTAIGYSSLIMALFGDVEVTTIERDEACYRKAVDTVNRAGLSDKIHLIYGDAKEVVVSDADFDIIFIDAAKASYIQFFEKFSENLKSGGVIVSDNLLFHGFVEHPEEISNRNRKQLVKKIDRFNHFLINHSKFDSYIYAIGDGISVSIKK